MPALPTTNTLSSAAGDKSQAIRLDRLTKWFFKDGRRFIAVDDVTADITAGSFVSLIGPSGCGKSTIFNCIAGFITPDQGAVIYEGKRISGPNVGLGYMTQKDALLPWRSVLSNVTLPLYLKGVQSNVAKDQAMAMIERVGLAEFANHLPRELSGGMQKRAALARTLVFSPDTLLMDEPFGNVDVQLKLQLQRELLSLWENERNSVVFVTHDLEEAIALSDQILVLARRPGRIKAIVDVNLPRPRDPVSIRFEPDFQQLRKQLWDLCDTSEESLSA